MRAGQIQPHIIGLSRSQFRFRLRHIHFAVGAACVEGIDEREIFLAQYNGLAHHVPVQINGPDHKIRLCHIGVEGEKDVLVGGGAGLGLFARGPEGAPDAPPEVNLVAQIQRKDEIVAGIAQNRRAWLHGPAW